MNRRSMRARPRARTAASAAALAALVVAVGVITASPSWATSGWERVPHNESLLGGTGQQAMLGVGSTGSGFVAVGYDRNVTAAAVWFSPDGSSWTRATHMEGVFGGPDSQRMYDVVQGPSNVVAVGSSGPGGDLDAAAWTGGGTIWKRAKHDEAVYGGSGDQLMYSVAAAGPGLVAVGSDGSGGDLDAAVWISDYGSRWTRVPHSEAVFGGSHRQWMKGVTAGGPGVVAVGLDESIDGSGDAAVWTSVDGTSWTQVPHSEAIFGGVGNVGMFAVTVGGPGLVAVGNHITNNESDAAVWTSVDGLTWARVPHDEAIFGGPSNQSMLDVVAGGPGLIAVGYDNDGVDRDAAVWTSVDGLAWTRVPHDEATFGGIEIETMRGVAVDGTGTAIAVGGQWWQPDFDSDAALWIYSPSSVPAPPPPPAPDPASSDATPGAAPSPSVSGGVTLTPTASPGTSATPTSGSAPASASGGSAAPFLIGGFAVLVVASGVLGWFLARRKP